MARAASGGAGGKKRQARGEASAEEPSFATRVWAATRRIPRGRVASYKLVGMVAGFPRSARFVGRVMKLAAPGSLPWHRVIAQDGRVVIGNPGLRAEQIRRLRAEGVDVSPEGRVDYDTYAWRPRVALAAARSEKPPRS